MKTIAVALAITLLSSGAAAAASFACGKAVSPFEKAICADPVLSKADETLAAAYGSDRTKLSPAGQAALQRSQRSWLAYAKALCRPGETPLNPARWSTYGKTPDAPTLLVNRCLEDAYKDRQKLLQRAVIRLGGHTFLATTSYRVKAARQDEDQPNSNPDAVHWVVTTVQIDAPDTDRERSWNAAMGMKVQDASEAPDPGGGGEGATFEDGQSDADISLDLVSASPDLIDVRLSTGIYAKGRPHGWYGSEAQIWSFRLGRALAPEDVFNERTDWRSALKEQVYQRFPADWRKPEYKDAVAGVVEQIGNWSLLPTGLEIAFDPYSVAGYIPPRPVVVPWAALQPYLRRALPFDPMTLRVPPS